MKIAIATAVYYPMINGVAVFAHNLATGLAARGHEVLVITPSQTGRRYTRTVDGVLTAYLNSTTVKVYPDQIHDASKKRGIFYKHGFKVSVFPGRQIRKLLNDFQPDVLHVQVSDPIGLSCVSWAHKHSVPVVTTEHSQPEVLTEPLHVPGVVKKPVNALLTAYFAHRESKSDYVTMPTQLAINNLLGKKKLEVPVEAVSNGVDLSMFRPGRTKASILAKYNIPAGRPIVLYVGRVDPEKRVGTVLEAFNAARIKVPGAILVVVGDGVDKKRLVKEAHALGCDAAVRFLGRVVGEELYELYKAGSVFATASEIETQGIVLIEAAASGLPLVAVNAGAVAEVCQNGVNGVLLEPGNDVAVKMAEALEQILLDSKLRAEYAQNSVKIAHEHDFDKTLDKFEEIYRKLTTL